MDKITPGIWINNKTQKEYKVEEEATDATNAHNNDHVVIYKEIERTLGYGSHILGDTFVRNKAEFLEKFTIKQ